MARELPRRVGTASGCGENRLDEAVARDGMGYTGYNETTTKKGLSVIRR
jgi:hypothetical protein